LVRTFAKLRSVTPGFDPANVLTFQVDLKGDRYKTASQSWAFYQAGLERMRGLPGVEAAAVTNVLPLSAQFNMPVTVANRPDAIVSAQMRMVTPDYFRVMKMALKQGREFTAVDDAGGAPVVIVNEAFARR